MITICEATVRYGGTPVFSRLSFSARPNEIVCIVGPSGCGKTTLLNLVSGLVPPESGTVRSRARAISYVFQEDRLLPWRTVRQNIRVVHPEGKEDHCDELMDAVGLTAYANLHPDQLSGGMRQRCAAARAFYYPADLLLMDEPFNALDHGLRRQMADYTLALRKKAPRTILFVTHDLDEALYIADRILVLSPRPARLVREITPPGFPGQERRLDTPEAAAMKRDLLVLV